ncbi:robin [Megavirus baoshan]|uniref:Robin n=2 Tax=Megavirus baoshan TaxID=2496520 RepID=A0A8K1T2F9_9VIRU|nr:robin [Megavirus baoshan]UFX99832.1 robin [Megavirus baoshan]
MIMKYYTFSKNYLRTYIDNISYNFKYITEPVTHTKIHINVDFGMQDLRKLCKLIPNVQNLVLHFGDKNIKYDLTPLAGLKKLKNIHIISMHQDKSRPRLLNIKCLSAPDICIYGQKLDSNNPVYIWPVILNPIYTHINQIQRHDNIISYDIKTTNYNQSVLKNNNIITDNIIIQYISDNVYQLIYRQYVEYHENKLCAIFICKKVFLQLVFNKPDIDINLDYPKYHKDLYIEDID